MVDFKTKGKGTGGAKTYVSFKVGTPGYKMITSLRAKFRTETVEEIVVEALTEFCAKNKEQLEKA